jgi:tetratricopeptide (TPR) repeat protein
MGGVLGPLRRARLRLAGTRRPDLSRAFASSSPSLVNLFSNPGLRQTGSTAALFDQPYDGGGVYVHQHNVGYAATVPGHRDVRGVQVSGTDRDNDTHVAPGGRSKPGQFRLGMRPGATYTAGVSLFLPEPLTGRLHPSALRIVVGCMRGSQITKNLVQSAAARNEFGEHRLTLTFTVPRDATAAWVLLQSGMSQGHGSVYWHSLVLTETKHPVPYFDGDSPDDAFFEYRWTGAANASPSRRTLRAPEAITERLGEAARPEIADQVGRLAKDGGLPEAKALARYLMATSWDEHALLARARLLQARRHKAAAQVTLRAAIDHGDSQGHAAFELGMLEEKAGRWQSAKSYHEVALTKQPTSSVRAYRLAWSLYKLENRDESRRAAELGLEFDTDLPFDGNAALSMDARAFGIRRDLGLFLAENLDQIRHQARQRLDRHPATRLSMPVFVYWAQGFDSAPPVVRRCLAALRATNPDADIHELTDETYRYYVDIPEDIVLATGKNKAHFSDLLRLALLEKFGGVWVDATCYVSEPLAPNMELALNPGGIFAFNYAGARISSWFLACRPDSYAIHLWRAAMWLWWEKRAELVDYYLLHHVFEMLYHLDAEFRVDWEKGLRLPARPPHALQSAMLSPFDAEGFEGFLGNAFVHKLRHKYKPHEVNSDSYLAYVIRGDVPPGGSPG